MTEHQTVIPRTWPEVFEARDMPSTQVQLPRSGRSVEIGTLLRFEYASPLDAVVPANYGRVPNKPRLVFDGDVLYPEFILVRLLERAGWVGGWMKMWTGRAFWRAIDEPVEIPPHVDRFMEQVEDCSGDRRGGRWDVVAWRGTEVLFVESKQRGNDQLRPNQRLWLECALDLGTPPASFLIVEWTREDRVGPSRVNEND